MAAELLGCLLDVLTLVLNIDDINESTHISHFSFFKSLQQHSFTILINDLSIQIKNIYLDDCSFERIKIRDISLFILEIEMDSFSFFLFFKM